MASRNLALAKKLDPETLAHPNDKGKGFIPGFSAYSSSKLCDLLTARAFAAATETQTDGMRVIAYNLGSRPTRRCIGRGRGGQS
jgi:hypothetical protein